MLKRLLGSGYFWLVLSVVLLLFCVGLIIMFWWWLHPSAPTTVSNSETLRNVGLLAGGLLAFVFALWRAWVAQSQSETGQLSLLNERYQRSAEMLGSRILAVRIGGIHALKLLAEEYPQKYYLQAMELLCAFVRNPAYDDGDGFTIGRDVQTSMTAIGQRRELAFCPELDLRHANLREAHLVGANLAGANLSGADLVRSDLTNANLSHSLLDGANLSQATLRCTNLSGAVFGKVTLPTRNVFAQLTQLQLKQAKADTNNPPNIAEGTEDSETGEPLVWVPKASP